LGWHDQLTAYLSRGVKHAGPNAGQWEKRQY